MAHPKEVGIGVPRSCSNGAVRENHICRCDGVQSQAPQAGREAESPIACRESYQVMNWDWGENKRMDLRVHRYQRRDIHHVGAPFHSD